MIALALLLALQGATAPPVEMPRTIQVQMGVAVQPETVTVGQHFVLRLRVRAPKGAEIGFPVGPDSGLAVEAVDPRREQAAADTTAVERTAIYRLVAWRTGAQHIALGAVVVSASGVDRRYAIPDPAVIVVSVRPRDSTGTIPRDARTVFLAPPLLWPWIIGGVLLFVLLVWIITRLARRPSRFDALGRALALARSGFARIDALGLLAAGERGRYVALHIDVLREYLARRIPGAEQSLTSTELLAALQADAPVPIPRLIPLLAEADLIKYANRPVTESRAMELASESRGLVVAIEQAVVHRAQLAAKPERAA
jgi:hypothetical protein